MPKKDHCIATYYNGSRSTREHKVQCQAKTKSTGAQCKRWAVEGKAVCRSHGGNNPGPPKQIGRYGKYATQSINEKLNELYSDVDYKSIKDELILLRALIGDEFDRAKEAKELTRVDKDGNKIYNKHAEIKAYKIIELVREIRQTVESIEKIENERQYMLSIKNVERLMYAWISILSKHITDVSTLVAIQRELTSTVIADPTQQKLGAGDTEKALTVRSRTRQAGSTVVL
jgi:hypothetical protein